MARDKSRKIRKIDRKFSKHQNRQSGRNSFLDCFTTLIPISAIVVGLVWLAVH